VAGNSFAKQIGELRKAEQLTQAEAAERWGVKLKTLQAWEIGQTKPIPFFAKCVLFYIYWRNRVPAGKPANAKKGRR